MDFRDIAKQHTHKLVWAALTVGFLVLASQWRKCGNSIDFAPSGAAVPDPPGAGAAGSSG